MRGSGAGKRLLIYGVVQGVGFRPTVYRIARDLGLKGYVRNNGSNVEVVLDRDHDEFISELRAGLPPLARLDRIDVEELEEGIEEESFVILGSSQGSRDAPIPPDTALCEDCLSEMRERSDRRYGYPFTNCTNCGARFSVISDMPYDRDKTAMREFELCEDCLEEYRDPTNRRFHAQTISCWREGLRYSLLDHEGREVETDDPIPGFATRIERGGIGVVKSWGGMHITCRLDRTTELREWYGRPAKPFAIMVRDMEIAGRIGVLDPYKEEILTSPQRPIVILERQEKIEGVRGAEGIEEVSPGLGNIGMFLPYTGVHYLMFEELSVDVLIMTSANPANEPMLIENEAALDLGLDCYLIHNRKIINRVDDSVLIPFEDRRFFVRKSRGYTPLFLPVGYDETVLSVGPERNVNASLSKAGRLYTSQYIGHTHNYNVMAFLDHGIRYLMRLLGLDSIDAVAMDLHPQYPTRKIAKRMGEEFDAPVHEVQHHFAHGASIMLDNRVEEPIACLSVDGTGYGTDGTVWGGEILVNDLRDYERVGSLQKIPLLGGDAAVKDPRRVVFAVKEILGLENDMLFSGTEARVFRKMMGRSVLTSSLGRILDCLSCWLGICCRRSYDGEPAMKLEPFLAKGKPRHMFDVEVEGTDPPRIQTVPMFGRLDELLVKKRGEASDSEKADLARSFVDALVREMVDLARQGAEGEGSGKIGLTGGVSYNIPIVQMVRDRVGETGMDLLLHDQVPNGDGGISIGQNIVVGERMKERKRGPKG